MSLTILITGASSGIGRAIAQECANHGHRLVLCGRNEARLNDVYAELSEFTDVQLLTFDVRFRESVKMSIDSLPENFKNIDVLVNNAGNAHGLDTIDKGNVDDWDAMIDGNVKGLLYVSQPIIEQMKERGNGQIINVGSTAGKEVYPKGNVYCASKHAVDALTIGMRLDLNPYGIKVGAVNPGMVETDFSKVRFKGDEERASQVYQGFDPLQADDVARVVYFMISQPPHVNIADLTVMCTAQASSTVVHKSQ